MVLKKDGDTGRQRLSKRVSCMQCYYKQPSLSRKSERETNTIYRGAQKYYQPTRGHHSRSLWTLTFHILLIMKPFPIPYLNFKEQEKSELA